MARWSRDNAKKLKEKENEENLKALIEFLVSQSGRKDLDINSELADKGEVVAKEGTLKEGQIAACIDCHDLEEPKFDPEFDGFGYPSLPGYGSREWLKDFISNPGSAAHYADKNRMPAFKDQMTEHDLDLLVRFMIGDYIKQPEPSEAK